MPKQRQKRPQMRNKRGGGKLEKEIEERKRQKDRDGEKTEI